MTLQTRGAVERLGPWFHNLHLPDGRQTAPEHPLGDFPRFKWDELAPHLPESLAGWTALDVGCNAGFYSFELARRGAQVVGIDADEHYLAQARWARALFELDDRVDLRRQTVYDLARSDETFDLILFMGVLYHLRHPLLALDAVAACARRLVVLQTLTIETDRGRMQQRRVENLDWDERDRLREHGWPALVFVEDRLFGDPTNWWVPDHAAVEGMARTSGLDPLVHPADGLWLCRPTGARPAVLAELRAAGGATPPRRVAQRVRHLF
jgi:tRNA (mo5U34)-methyltransferase